MEASCRFHPWASSRHCRGICARNMATATTMSVTISRHSEYMRDLPCFIRRRALLRRALGGWQISETAFLHSGLPFSVLSAPYTANNNGIFSGQCPQYANRVPGVALYRKTSIPGSNANRQPPVAQPGCLLRRWSIPALVHVPLEIPHQLPIRQFRPKQLPRLTSPIPRST